MPENRSAAGQSMQRIVEPAAPSIPDTARLQANCRSAARLASLVVVCIGISVLLGWACDIPTLRTLVPGYSAMVPNTALGLLLCGVALWVDRGGGARGRKRFLVQVCAGIVVLIGVATLVQYILGRDLGIDGLLFPGSVMALDPSRMAAMSAVTFALLGSTLFLFDNRRGFAVGQFVVIIGGVLCLFNAIGFLYGIRSFYGLAFKAGSTAMAIHASLAFIMLCTGVLLSRPGWGLMSTITSPSPGGVMARRMLPTALIIPVSTGWLRWHGQLMGLYDTAFGLTLFTAVTVVIFAFVIWRSGQILNGLDIERAGAEGKMLQLADSMPQIVWMANSTGENDYYNRRCYEYTGMTFEQTRDGGWVNTIHPADRPGVMELRNSAFALREPYSMEYRFKRASDGMYRWHLSQGIPVFNPEGQLVRWIGTCTDIEDYKEAESKIIILNEGLEQRVRERTVELDLRNQQLAAANQELKSSSLKLQHSNRELQDFASVASHDLQEPLRKVQAFGDRLKSVSREVLTVQASNYLDRMLNATQRMQALIQDLLKFARVTSQAHQFLPVNLAQVAREVLSDLEVRIAETDARVEVGDLPTIDADALQMRQLFQNLIGNALKFHQTGLAPVVRVYADTSDLGRANDGMLRLIVEDNGIGFDEKYLDRIFTVFQRLHGRAEYEGTGVGLAICRKIAERHGGDITASSAPGQGASFRIALPFRHADENSLPVPEPI